MHWAAADVLSVDAMFVRSPAVHQLANRTVLLRPASLSILLTVLGC